jgi:hypothetical protein
MSEFSILDTGKHSINEFRQSEMYMMYNMASPKINFLCISSIRPKNKLIELDATKGERLIWDMGKISGRSGIRRLPIGAH